MIEVVIITFVFVWIKGYKREMFDLFKHWSIYPIILTCIFQIYSIYMIIQGDYWFLKYSKYIEITSLLFYFALIWEYNLMDISILKTLNMIYKNKIIIWLTSPVTIGGLFIFIGSKLNKIAMFYNGNKMPVFVSNSWATGYIKPNMFIELSKYGDSHVFGDQYTKLIPLTNIWDVGFMSFSIGDLMIRVFVVLILYYSIKSQQVINNS